MTQLMPQSHEAVEDFLWRLGSMKEVGAINLTWPELAAIFNSYSEEEHGESYWRKQYRQMRLEREMEEALDPHPVDVPKVNNKTAGLQEYFNEIEKRRIRTRDERASYSRMLRKDATNDAVLDLFREEIRRAVPPKVQLPVTTKSSDNSVYAMLSDIHYGLTFDNYAGSYDSEIAEQRVMQYARKIVEIGEANEASTCYVSLMGDMISGNIHSTIRVENRENVIEQVVGVSELVSSFLYYLAEHFEDVFVNSVDGNHSRVEAKSDDSLRAEKLDALIPWYCKTKLENVHNIDFLPNKIDSTIGSFDIKDKFYVCVHGDMDNNLKTAVQRIERLSGRKVDYILAAHLHVPEMRMEDVGYIRNGSVCGSGDEYTFKKRLFSGAAQVCLVLDDTGSVESIHSVAL